MNYFSDQRVQDIRNVMINFFIPWNLVYRNNIGPFCHGLVLGFILSQYLCRPLLEQGFATMRPLLKQGCKHFQSPRINTTFTQISEISLCRIPGKRAGRFRLFTGYSGSVLNC